MKSISRPMNRVLSRHGMIELVDLEFVGAWVALCVVEDSLQPLLSTVGWDSIFVAQAADMGGSIGLANSHNQKLPRGERRGLWDSLCFSFAALPAKYDDFREAKMVSVAAHEVAHVMEAFSDARPGVLRGEPIGYLTGHLTIRLVELWKAYRRVKKTQGEKQV